ncbi:MAG: mechanosensitive ion channel family protein [Pirellulales bacterium]
MQFLTALTGQRLSIPQQAGFAAAVVVGALVFYLLASRGLASLQTHRHLPGPLVHLLRRIARWVVCIAAFVVLLQVAGVLHSVFAAVSGMLALLAIGFVAVWSVLSNTLCSLILMITRPFRIGDTLCFPPDELRGRVVNFSMLFTTLETEDGFTLQVPNNIFFQRPILRKKGEHRINLTDQLYRDENARLGTAPLVPRPHQTNGASTVAAN